MKAQPRWKVGWHSQAAAKQREVASAGLMGGRAEEGLAMQVGYGAVQAAQLGARRKGSTRLLVM